MSWENEAAPVKQERQDKIQAAHTYIMQSGFTYQTGNNGVHMQVQRNGVTIADLWPTTGKWRIRNTPIDGYGMKELLRHMQ